MIDRSLFLPISREDMVSRGWYYCDFLLVTGDAYVDHPSFGTAVISRVLENAGYRVAILSQPDFRSVADFAAMGKPRYGVLINAGNVDSMVAHYTAAKKRRNADIYTPGGKMGRRPDRAVIVYSNRVREAFGDIPIVIGGLEASLRRFAHYDYWDDRVRRSILADSGADILSYGMGERSMVEIADRLKKGGDYKDICGICYLTKNSGDCQFKDPIMLPSFDEVCHSNSAYAQAAYTQQNENDHVRGHALIQPHGELFLVQNPPALPLEGELLDRVYDLPYTRSYHPEYEAQGGVAAIEEVKFSIIHNRGCFGACNFCALAMHQGRYISARSHESVIKEAEKIIADPDFKGYIHDVGGPTANFRRPACKKQKKHGTCADRQCLFPVPCPNIEPSHRDYVSLLEKLRKLPGVKKVFIRSGVRFDYAMLEKDKGFINALVKHHVSGQLKVAPEHVSPNALNCMGKPYGEVYDRFCELYEDLNRQNGMNQYLVPYLMSSHPGSGIDDAIMLAQYLKEHKMSPKQVQDFYPTPGTLATAMFYTGIDPRNMRPVYVARSMKEKSMQWALLRFGDPKQRKLVAEALKSAGREDLIGYGKKCLIPPVRSGESNVADGSNAKGNPAEDRRGGKGAALRVKPGGKGVKRSEKSGGYVGGMSAKGKGGVKSGSGARNMPVKGKNVERSGGHTGNMPAKGKVYVKNGGRKKTVSGAKKRGGKK